MKGKQFKPKQHTQIMQIGEMVIYDKPLSKDEMLAISEYLLNVTFNKHWYTPITKLLFGTKWKKRYAEPFALHLDATDQNTITKDGQNKVSKWESKSGNTTVHSDKDHEPIWQP